jgi:hypothetical protein
MSLLDAPVLRSGEEIESDDELAELIQLWPSMDPLLHVR